MSMTVNTKPALAEGSLCVADWPLVKLSLDETGSLALDRCEVLAVPGPTCLGKAVCLARTSKAARVGIEFDWAEVLPRVLVVANPHLLVSNILLMHSGRACTPLEQLAFSLQLLATFPWQATPLAARTA